MGHLTYDDRLSIQQMLKEGYGCADIGRYLGKSRTTISREILKHRQYKASEQRVNACVNRRKCKISVQCREVCHFRKGCLTCYKCNLKCPDFVAEKCDKTAKSPYVCNGCSRVVCRYGKWLYLAREAQIRYEETLKESRRGISLSGEEIAFLNENVVPLIKKGISVAAACQQYADRMPISVKTMYTYIEKGYLDVKNVDLRLKVRRAYRNKTGPVLRVDKHCHIGRSFSDYLRYIREHPGKSIVQMDTVIGRKGGKTILSLLFTNCDMQLYYLRNDNTASTVTAVFDDLRETLGEDFCKLFQVILTDRGSEFTDPVHIETDFQTGEITCKVFYCDPMQSNQKSNCERNHELLRYILPKGVSFDSLTLDDLRIVTAHVNSYPREKWNWKTPIDLFAEIYGKEVLEKLGLERVPIEEVRLKKNLI